MRMIVAALAASVSLWAAGAAADPWTSPDGKLRFDLPSGWLVAPQQATNMTYIVAGSGDKECDVMARTRADTASAPPDLMRQYGNSPISQADWTRVIGMVPDVFGGDGTYVSSEVNTDGFWPVNLAQFNSAGHAIYASIQLRPGVDLWAFCQSRAGADDATTYAALLRSVALSEDPQLQAEAERLAAQRQAAAQSQTSPR
ncbi:MAG: hypothetical protein ABUL42_03125 [Terricaulis silvestris]